MLTQTGRTKFRTSIRVCTRRFRTASIARGSRSCRRPITPYATATRLRFPHRNAQLTSSRDRSGFPPNPRPTKRGLLHIDNGAELTGSAGAVEHERPGSGRGGRGDPQVDLVETRIPGGGARKHDLSADAV